MLARGWLARQNAARGKMAQREEWRAIDAERQRETLEEQCRQREAAEHRQRVLTETKVRCPCCDTGSVSAELSERVQRALSRLPAGSQPDPDLLARILAGLAPIGATPAPVPTVKPAPIALPPVQLDPIVMGTDDAPADDESAIAVYRREEATREAEIVAMSETVNAAEIAALEADAQDVVETTAPAPAPEPVQPRKHRGRRSGPLPFMSDGQ